MTAAPEQLAYEEWERVRYPGKRRVPWDHGALTLARPAWKAAVRVAVEASPELAQARQALRDLTELYERATAEARHVHEQLKSVHGHVAAVAHGLEQRADVNRPSKVTQICDDIAASLRRALDGS